MLPSVTKVSLLLTQPRKVSLTVYLSVPPRHRAPYGIQSFCNAHEILIRIPQIRLAEVVFCESPKAEFRLNLLRYGAEIVGEVFDVGEVVAVQRFIALCDPLAEIL
jgi:hypothetical protein